jgi:uncharacterized Zn-binding protein involved in type VI secretion
MPAAARVGDRGIPHCSGFSISTGSSDVFINGRPAALSGSRSTPHLTPGRRCRTHTSTVIASPRNVFVNGRPIACVGDKLSMCTAIATGSSDVFVL